MREIKFRAWGINSKEFLSPDGKVFGLTLKEIQNIEDISLWEFQQFTGLKDKNGKEIYEGDIITFIGGNSIQTYGENSDIRVVEVLEDTKQLGWKGSGYYFCKNNCEKLVEVIGNIFENPELLSN